MELKGSAGTASYHHRTTWSCAQHRGTGPTLPLCPKRVIQTNARHNSVSVFFVCVCTDSTTHILEPCLPVPSSVSAAPMCVCVCVWPWRPIKMQGVLPPCDVLSREWGNYLLRPLLPPCSDDKQDRHSLAIILLFGPNQICRNLCATGMQVM
jgi:hypothetical protein